MKTSEAQGKAPATREEIRTELKALREERITNPIAQAAKVGRAAMFLLGSKTYLANEVKQQSIMRKPGEPARYDPAIHHTLSIHESTVDGRPPRVSLVATMQELGKDTRSQVIALPQDEEAASAFAKNQGGLGLFVMDGRTKHFYHEASGLYAERLVHSAGVLLELIDREVEIIPLPEPEVLQERLAA